MTKQAEKLYTTRQVAKLLDLNQSYVADLAKRMGLGWMIGSVLFLTEHELELMRGRNTKRGNPGKEKV